MMVFPRHHSAQPPLSRVTPTLPLPLAVLSYLHVARFASPLPSHLLDCTQSLQAVDLFSGDFALVAVGLWTSLAMLQYFVSLLHTQYPGGIGSGDRQELQLISISPSELMERRNGHLILNVVGRARLLPGATYTRATSFFPSTCVALKTLMIGKSLLRSPYFLILHYVCFRF